MAGIWDSSDIEHFPHCFIGKCCCQIISDIRNLWIEQLFPFVRDNETRTKKSHLRCPGNCIRFCPIKKHPKNLVAQNRNHLFRLKLCGSAICAGLTMAVLLVSAGLTHVTARSTAELVGSGWPRLASATMAHYLLFMSVISRRLLGASSHGSSGRDLGTRAKGQAWATHI